tara:strand:+ start:95 stop:553 length:459 start_codon:yes stop_codon:yes gene_type:complete
MESLPKVPTVKTILEKIMVNNKKLEKGEVDKLTRLKLGDDQMFSLKDRDFLLEISGMMNILGFEDVYKYLKSSQKENNREIILKKSPVFDSSRKRNFLEITKDLRSVKVESHTQCLRCKQFHVDTITKQTRSADEGATDYHRCSDCGFQWKE